MRNFSKNPLRYFFAVAKLRPSQGHPFDLKNQPRRNKVTVPDFSSLKIEWHTPNVMSPRDTLRRKAQEVLRFVITGGQGETAPEGAPKKLRNAVIVRALMMRHMRWQAGDKLAIGRAEGYIALRRTTGPGYTLSAQTAPAGKGRKDMVGEIVDCRFQVPGGTIPVDGSFELCELTITPDGTVLVPIPPLSAHGSIRDESEEGDDPIAPAEDDLFTWASSKKKTQRGAA